MFRLFAIGSLVLQSFSPSASEDALSLGAYVSQLDQLEERLRASSAEDAATMSPGISPLWVVDTGRERVAVDMRWLVAGLREATDAGIDWNASGARLRRRLLALRAHATELAKTDSEPLYGSFRSAVADVLTGSEFRQFREAGWRQRLQERLAAWIEWLFQRIGVGSGGGVRIAIALAWAAGLAALAGLGLWLARTLAARSRAVSVELAPIERRRLSSHEWALRAREAFRAGDAREAVRCAYNGALRRLEEDGAWRLERSRTPREYLRLLTPQDTRGPAVRELTDIFERVWYGRRAVEIADADRVSSNLEKLGCLHPSDRAI